MSGPTNFGLLITCIVLCFGSIQSKTFLGVDLDHLNISCKVCHQVETELYDLATNNTRLTSVKETLNKYICKNDFIKPFPHVQALCTDYVEGLFVAVMKTLVYAKTHVKVCRDMFRCGRKFILKALEVRGQGLLFIFLNEISKSSPKLTSVVTAAISAGGLDLKRAETKLVESVCEEAAKSKNDTTAELSKRVEEICNFGLRPECAICETGSDLAAWLLPKVLSTLPKYVLNLCNKDKTCLFIVSMAFQEIHNLVQRSLKSNVACYKIGQCNEPSIFKTCHGLPKAAENACDVYLLFDYKHQQQLLKEHMLKPITPAIGCETCQNVTTAILHEVKDNEKFIYASLKKLCKSISLWTDACLFFIYEEFDYFLGRVKTVVTPDALCPRFGLCTKSMTTSLSVVNDGADHQYFCNICNTVVVFLQAKLRDALLKKDIQKRLLKLCSRFPKYKDSCEILANKYFSTIYDFVIGTAHSANVCSLVPRCSTKGM